ncbi:hypothetical protein HBH55_090200 [Parastagonospora nodorum]|nr:hypothetical protein HBH55_090200 [Parastagonospora nodorum]
MFMPLLLPKINPPPPPNTNIWLPHHRPRSLLALGRMPLHRRWPPPLRLLTALLHDNYTLLALPRLWRAHDDNLLNLDFIHALDVFLRLGAGRAGVEVAGREDLAAAVEVEGAVDEGAGLVVEGFAVVDTRGATGAVAAGDDVPALHEERDLLERRGDGMMAGATVGGVVKIVVVGLVVGDVDGDAVRTLLGHWLRKKTSRADVELIVDGKTSLVFGVYVEVGSDNWCTIGGRLVESSVPSREQLVT